MAACEKCWEHASRDAMLLGGSVVDHYKKRLADNASEHEEMGADGD